MLVNSLKAPATRLHSNVFWFSVSLIWLVKTMSRGRRWRCSMQNQSDQRKKEVACKCWKCLPLSLENCVFFVEAGQERGPLNPFIVEPDEGQSTLQWRAITVEKCPFLRAGKRQRMLMGKHTSSTMKIEWRPGSIPETGMKQIYIFSGVPSCIQAGFLPAIVSLEPLE